MLKDNYYISIINNSVILTGRELNKLSSDLQPVVNIDGAEYHARPQLDVIMTDIEILIDYMETIKSSVKEYLESEIEIEGYTTDINAFNTPKEMNLNGFTDKFNDNLTEKEQKKILRDMKRENPYVIEVRTSEKNKGEIFSVNNMSEFNYGDD